MLIQVRVKPSAQVSSLTQGAHGTWLASLKAPPVDGRANAELVALLARYFGCSRSRVTIKSGASSRIKRIELDLE